MRTNVNIGSLKNEAGRIRIESKVLQTNKELDFQF